MLTNHEVLRKLKIRKKESPVYDPNPSFMFSHDLVLNSLVPPPECWSTPPGRGCEGGGPGRVVGWTLLALDISLQGAVSGESPGQSPALPCVFVSIRWIYIAPLT